MRHQDKHRYKETRDRWDWLFGTLLHSGEKRKVRFGIIDTKQNYNSFWYNLYTPFKNLFRKIILYFSRKVKL